MGDLIFVLLLLLALGLIGLEIVRSRKSSGTRPAAAQARLDEIEALVESQYYHRVFAAIDYEMFEADRRGDLEALRTLHDLAKQIAADPEAWPADQDAARERAEVLLPASLGQGLQPRPAAPRAPRPRPRPPAQPRATRPAEATPRQKPQTKSRAASAPVVEPEPEPAPARSALEIAAERYARGEITREEFQQLKDDLSV